jgi:fucose permease
VCFVLVGLFMGPMYPSCVLLITELMPGDLHTGTIGFLACLGVVGSAIMPFITGALSQAVSEARALRLSERASEAV